MIVQILRGDVCSVLPKDCLIKAELDELLLVTQFLECRVLQ